MTKEHPVSAEPGDLDLSATFEDDDWPQRLRAAVAETLAARQARRDLRAQLAERRDAGLERRHAEKLGRRNADRVSDVACRTGTASQVATGPATESQVATPSKGAAVVGQKPTTDTVTSTDSTVAATTTVAAGAHTQTSAELATLERLRRAGQGGWRPTPKEQ